MTGAITFTIGLQEPALLGAPGGDPNTEFSQRYIPGGALRGALVGRYLAQGQRADSDQFKTLFLTGKVRFLNAYPAVPDRSLPISLAWARKKDAGDYVFDRTQDAQRKEVEKGIPKPGAGFYLGMTRQGDDWCVGQPEVEYEIAIHTARDRQLGRATENSGALFRYKALARGQDFAAAIVYDDDVADADVKALEKLLAEPQIILGGSRSAGYGKAWIADVQPLDSNWTEGSSILSSGDTFVLYLTSDAILYDPATGAPARDILPFLPGDPGRFKISRSFASTGWVGGFNTHWGLPLSQQWAFKMGSTWVLTVKGGPLTEEEIGELRALERRGLGLRTVEGFGRFLLAPRWPDDKFLLTEIKTTASPAETQHKMNKAEQKLLDRMNKRIAEEHLDRMMMARVNELTEKNKVRGRLSRSQLARIRLRIRQEAGTDDFNGFINYLNSTKDRKSADDQFRKFRVNGRNFREWLLGLAGEPATIWTELCVPNDWKPLTIGDEPYDFREKLAHEYTIKFISSLCRQLAKEK